MTAIRTAIFSLCALTACATIARARDAIVPDQFPSIGKALANATDRDGDGTIEIFVRGGIYRENVRILASNVHIEGEKSNRPVIEGDGTAPVLHVESRTSGYVANVEVKNLIVTGGRSVFDGIEVTRAQRTTFENVDAFGNANGMRLSNVSVIVLRGCNMNSNADSGFLAKNVGSVEVLGCVASGNRGHGVDLGSVSKGILSSNAFVENGGDGLRVRRGFDLAVEKNKLSMNGSDGAHIEFAARMQLTSNDCAGNTESGLRTRGTLGCGFSLNQFRSNRGFGLESDEDVGADYDVRYPGIQRPLGDNTSAGNGRGDMRIG
jgi:hypothetical protein